MMSQPQQQNECLTPRSRRHPAVPAQPSPQAPTPPTRRQQIPTLTPAPTPETPRCRLGCLWARRAGPPGHGPPPRLRLQKPPCGRAQPAGSAAAAGLAGPGTQVAGPPGQDSVHPPKPIPAAHLPQGAPTAPAARPRRSCRANRGGLGARWRSCSKRCCSAGPLPRRRGRRLKRERGPRRTRTPRRWVNPPSHSALFSHWASESCPRPGWCAGGGGRCGADGGAAGGGGGGGGKICRACSGAGELSARVGREEGGKVAVTEARRRVPLRWIFEFYSFAQSSESVGDCMSY
jgi:hypothetical protein